MKLCELHWVTWGAWIVWILLSSVSCNYWCVPHASMQWVLMKKTQTHKLLILGGVRCIDKDIKHLGENVLIQGEVKCIDKDIEHLWEKVLIPGEAKLKTFPPIWREAGIGVGARCNWCLRCIYRVSITTNHISCKSKEHHSYHFFIGFLNALLLLAITD